MELDWRHGLVLGLVGASALLSTILAYSGYSVLQVVTVTALVMVPVLVTVGAFLLVWRYVWRLDEQGRPRAKR